jgi:hypothetical protein
MMANDKYGGDPSHRTRQWLETVVIGLNFCPFAKRELRRNAIRFTESPSHRVEKVLEQLVAECEFLDKHPDAETTLLILPAGFEEFLDYLDLLELAERLLAELGYEGVYQIASFHPDYCFADADHEDAANFTNRSPYPMLHLLREASLDAAIDNHPDIDAIPQSNIDKARMLGADYFRALLEK